MPNRLFPFLLLATTIAATGALVVALSPSRPLAGQAAATAALSGTADAAPAHAAAPILLPTIVVRPEAPIPTLATVTVRADKPRSTTRVTDDPSAELAGSPGLSLLPSAAFDMPYYSFGRSMRRANKE